MKKNILLPCAASLILALSACGGAGNAGGAGTVQVPVSTETAGAKDSGSAGGGSAGSEAAGGASKDGADATDSGSAGSDTAISGTFENAEDGGHAIIADGETAVYDGAVVTKTGEAEGDEADFYGDNAAVFATNGASLTLKNSEITTDGTHANGVFSYGEGTTVTVSDSKITTSGNCSGGLMTTGGGTMIAEDLTIHTTGRSSAAIRSDRGGGTVQVTGGTYGTDGTGSPAIYSTADITVSDAELTTTASQGVVVEGKNSVTLNNVTLTADNNKKNGNHSDYYQAVMIYQSMSGDAAEGLASFTMKDGSLVNKNGDVFFVNNTAADIRLENASITNDGDGVFLRAAAAGWGREGSNGGHVNLYAKAQAIEGDILADNISSVNLYLADGSSFTGAVNPDGGGAGGIYVEISGDAVWTLTADSWIDSLTCAADSIDLNGYALYVNGEKYQEGTASEGTAIKVESSSKGSSDSGKPAGGKPGKDGSGRPDGGKSGDGSGRPSGGKPGDGSGKAGDTEGGRGKGGPRPDGSERPAMPDGETPPEMPEGGMPPEMPEAGMPPEMPGGETNS